MADPTQPTVAGALGITPGGEVKNLGGAMTVQPGGEVKDLGQQIQVTPQTPAEKELAAREAKDKPAAGAAQETPAAPEEETPDPRFTPYNEELTKHGKLSEESIKKAAKEFGVSEKVVKAYAESQAANLAVNNDAATQALHDSQVGAVKEVAGGDKPWADYVAWADMNDKASLQLIADAVGGNSPEVSKVVVQSAIAKAKAQGYGAPRDATNSAQGAQPQAVTGYPSRAEQNAAIRDPKYKTDPNYRKSVEAKIAASSF